MTRRLLLLVLSIVCCLLAVVAYQDAGDVLSFVGASWAAIALGLLAGALI